MKYNRSNIFIVLGLVFFGGNWISVVFSSTHSNCETKSPCELVNFHYELRDFDNTTTSILRDNFPHSFFIQTIKSHLEGQIQLNSLNNPYKIFFNMDNQQYDVEIQPQGNPLIQGLNSFVVPKTYDTINATQIHLHKTFEEDWILQIPTKVIYLYNKQTIEVTNVRIEFTLSQATADGRMFLKVTQCPKKDKTCRFNFNHVIQKSFEHSGINGALPYAGQRILQAQVLQVQMGSILTNVKVLDTDQLISNGSFLSIHQNFIENLPRILLNSSNFTWKQDLHTLIGKKLEQTGNQVVGTVKNLMFKGQCYVKNI